MSDPFSILGEEARHVLTDESVPEWADPMLATLVDETFSDPDWIFERKLDGERCLAFRDDASVRLLSRSQKDLDDTYPELVDALEGQRAGQFVLDGEIVAFSGGVTSFQRLQQRMSLSTADEARRSNVAVHFYLFDILHLGGRRTTELPLRDRKALLKKAISFDDPIRYTPHRNEDGEAFYAQACDRGWEGLIAKDATKPYTHERSRDWLKFKCVADQEFVIGGYTDPEGSRIGFGAILVGYHDDGDLAYAGKVGTGFDDDTLERLGGRMEELERDDSPFDRGNVPTKGVHFVDPQIVAQIGFTEWTDRGRLRHPRFLGTRDDKQPGDVVRERPQ